MCSAVTLISKMVNSQEARCCRPASPQLALRRLRHSTSVTLEHLRHHRHSPAQIKQIAEATSQAVFIAVIDFPPVCDAYWENVSDTSSQAGSEASPSGQHWQTSSNMAADLCCALRTDLRVDEACVRVLLEDVLPVRILVGLDPADVLAAPEPPLAEAVPPRVQPLRAAAPAQPQGHAMHFESHRGQRGV